MSAARTLFASALVASIFVGCSDDASTSPQNPPPPALEGTWRYPKAGGVDADLFRFTLEFRKDTVIYLSLLDGNRLDSVRGLWSMSGDTIVASLKDSIDFPPAESVTDKGAPIPPVGSNSRIRSTMKWMRSGTELRDPLLQIEIGKL